MLSEKIKETAEKISSLMKEIIKVKYEDEGPWKEPWVTTPEKIKEYFDSGLELIIVYKEGNDVSSAFMTDLIGEKVKLSNGEIIDIEEF